MKIKSKITHLNVDEIASKTGNIYKSVRVIGKRARQLSTTSREPLVEWDNDKPTIVALREIEEGLLDNETLEEWLKDDILSDGFSAEPISQEGENIG